MFNIFYMLILFLNINFVNNFYKIYAIFFIDNSDTNK
jgi:hypothetical protein